MASKIATALAALAMAFPALAAENGNRDNAYAYAAAQYCIPQTDDFPDMTRLYCWSQRGDNRAVY